MFSMYCNSCVKPGTNWKLPRKLPKITPFIEQCNWKEINLSSHKKDWKKCDSNNKLIALNILFVPYKSEQLRPSYISKHNSAREAQVMNTDNEKWHYLVVKSLSAVFKGITSKHDGNFYYLGCFHSFRTENKLKKYKNVCKIHEYCYIDMLKKDNKILKYNHGEKSIKVPFIIYVDTEPLLVKIDICRNNPKKS